jgi:hypothetical protein
MVLVRYYTAVFICAFTLAMVIAVSFVIPEIDQENSVVPTPRPQEVVPMEVHIPEAPTFTPSITSFCRDHTELLHCGETIV